MFTKLARWWLVKKQKKEREKKLTGDEKKKEKIYTNLKKLYKFVQFLNTKGLVNRHQRKAFWRSVQKNEPIMEKTIQNLIKQYEPKKDNEK